MTEIHATRTIILRARTATSGLVPGALIAAPKGGAVYRVAGAVKVYTAGDPAGSRLRLVLHRLVPGQAPEGAELRPWPRAPRPVRRVAAPDPGGMMLTEAVARTIASGRDAAELAQLARAGRVGRDDEVRAGRDFGPGVRLVSVHARRRGGVLREADVTLEDGAEPDAPNRIVRRARRIDPLVVLLRTGTITGQGFDAVERLRADMQAAAATIAISSTEAPSRLPAHQRVAIGDRPVAAASHLRQALAAVAPLNQAELLWVALGGSLSGYATFTRTRHGMAAERLRGAVGELLENITTGRQGPMVAALDLGGDGRLVGCRTGTSGRRPSTRGGSKAGH